MRKLISTTMMGVLLTGFGFGISGCSDEAGTKKEVITTSPGGKTVETQESKIKQSGDNPPAPTKAP
jgi:hypothetical protein